MDDSESIVAKKIVSYLDEMTLDKSIENRLAQARAKALLKLNEKQFIEVQETPVMALKAKNTQTNNWLIVSLLALLFMAVLQNPIRENFFQDKEKVTLASPEYEDFLGSLHQRNQEFQEWDNKMDKLLND